MDATLIFMGLAILVVIYLIFKFIKKLVLAVFSLFFFLILVLAGVAGLVYMDYNYLTSQSDFDLKIVYKVDEKYSFGTNLRIVNKTPDMQSVKSISEKDLASLKPEDVSSSDKTFVVVVDEELFKVLMTKESYEIEEFKKTAQFSSYDLSLTKFDVIEIMDSQDDVGTFLDIVFKRNKISGVQRTVMEPIARSLIESELGKMDLSLKEAVFLTVVSEEVQNEKNAVALLEGFKEGTFEVYPERFSFKLVRLLPVEFVKSNISDFAK